MLKCKRCQFELEMTKREFKDKSIHFEVFCKRCHYHEYLPQTKENIKLFENVKILPSNKRMGIKRSKVLKKKKIFGISEAKRFYTQLRNEEKTNELYSNYLDGILN